MFSSSSYMAARAWNDWWTFDLILIVLFSRSLLPVEYFLCLPVFSHFARHSHISFQFTGLKNAVEKRFKKQTQRHFLFLPVCFVVCVRLMGFCPLSRSHVYPPPPPPWHYNTTTCRTKHDTHTSQTLDLWLSFQAAISDVSGGKSKRLSSVGARIRNRLISCSL